MLLLLPAASAATITTVCAGCPLDVAVAAAAPGDTLWLEPGVHPASSIAVAQDLEIRGLTPDAQLDPGGAVAFRVAPGVEFSLVDVTLSQVDGRLAVADAGAIVNLYGLRVEDSTTFGGPDGGLVTFLAGGRALVGGSTFFTVAGDGYGLVHGDGPVDVVVTDVAVVDWRAAQGGCLAHVPNGTLTLTGARIQDCRDGNAPAIVAASATVDATDFVSCASLSDGGCLAVSGGATISGSSFDGGSSEGCGGAVVATGGLTLRTTSFSGATARSSGGAVCLRGSGALLAEDATFTSNEASDRGFGGALLLEGGGDHVLRRCAFDRNTTTGTGGAVAVPSATSLTVEDCSFTGNTAEKGAAIASQFARLDVRGSTFCENTTVEGGAAISAASQVAPLAVSASVFLLNEGAGGTLRTDGALEVRDVDFVDDGSDAAIEVAAGSVDVTNTLYVGVETAVAGAGAVARSAWNAYSEVDDPGLGGFGDDPVRGAPGLRARGPFARCDAYDLVPRPGSPLVDAGDPSLVVDGSRSDIGAFELPPGSTTTPGIDRDLDGFSPPQDCDDDDPSVFPGSTVVRDGVDHDCDGVVSELHLRGRSCGCGDHDVDLPTPTEEPTVDTGLAAAPLVGLLLAAVRRRRR